MKVTGLLFWVQDNTLTEKFYKKIGFSIATSDDQVSVVRLGNFEITLVTMRDEEKFAHDALAAHKGKGAYVYIAVEDVDIFYRQLIQKGVHPTTAPQDWSWGNREFIVKDPDGYKLCFWQKLPQLSS